MAAGNLGSLVVSLGLDAVQFTAGLTKAEYQLRQLNSSIQRFGGNVKGIFASLGVGISVAGIVAFGRETVLTAEHLRNLATDTGSSVEELSRLSNIAKISGSDFDTFQGALLRLSTGLSGSGEDASKVAKALQFLGVSAKDPANALQETADKLSKFADGAGKVAFARDVFGKSGGVFLSTLKSIAENTDQVNTKTTEQAENATKLAEQIRSLGTNSTTLANVFLNNLVPAISAVADGLVTATKAAGGLGVGLNAFLTNAFNKSGNFKSDLADIDDAIGRAQKRVSDAQNDPSVSAKLFDKLGLEGTARDINAANESLDVALERRKQILEKQRKDALALSTGDDHGQFLRKTELPQLPFRAPDGVAEESQRKALDGQIKQLDAFIQREKDILNAREDFLQHYYSQGLLSVEQNFSQVQGARDTELKNVLAFYDQQIAATEKFKRTASKSADRQDADNRIQDIREKQIKLVADAGFAEGKLARQRQVDADKYAADLDELNAKILDLEGNTARAAAIRFEAQNGLLRNTLASAGNAAGTAELDRLKAQQQAVINLGEAQRVYSNKLEETGIALARIDLLQQSGSITEIDAINQKASAAAKYVVVLTAQLDVLKRLAEDPAQGKAAREAALLGVQKLQLEIDSLALATDALAKKFNDIGSGAFSTFLQDLIGRTKTVKQAFLDMGKTITQQINKIASDDIASRLFGKEGPLSGFGNLLGQAFGSGGGSAAAATGAASGTTLTAAGATLDTAGLGLNAAGLSLDAAGISLDASGLSIEVAATALLAAADAIVAASAAQGGSSVASGLGSAASSIDFGAFFANGGNPPVGKVSVVGEKGPELFVPRGAGTIIPADEISRRRGAKQTSIRNTIQVNVMPGASRESADQAAASMARALQRAQGRLS